MKLVKCPKCGYNRQATDTAPDYECPSCGVVYAKYDQEADQRRIAQAAALRDEAERARWNAAAKTDSKQAAADPGPVRASPKAAPPADAAHAKTTSCKACGGLVSWQARNCPHCGQRKPAGKRPPKPVSRRTIVIYSIGLVVVMLALANRPVEPEGVDAWTICQAAARKVLKSPSSAEFDNNSIRVRRTQDGFNVVGIVHAANSFGVPLPTEYECELGAAGTSLTVTHLGIDGRPVY